MSEEGKVRLLFGLFVLGFCSLGCFCFFYLTKKKIILNFNRVRIDSALDNIEFVKIHLIPAYRNTIKPVIYHFNP